MNDLAEATGTVSEKEEVAADVCDRSSAVDDALRYVAYMYLKHVNRAMKKNALYTEHAHWERWVMYKIEDANLRRMFESLPNFVAVALGIMKTELLIRAVVELDEREKVVASTPQPDTPACLLMESRKVVFVPNPSRFRNSGCSNIIAPHSKGSILIKLSHPSKR